MKIYNKLVRDKIIQIIKSKGQDVKYHIADEKEYWQKLKEKLQEEVIEVLEETNISEELADVMEVIYAICKFKGIDFQEVEKIRKDKLNKRGGFENKIILEKS